MSLLSVLGWLTVACALPIVLGRDSTRRRR